MNIQSLYQIYLKHPQISTDTREILPDSLFFALKGAHFDANTFAKTALEKGAAYVIIDRQEFYINEQTIVVHDVLESLQKLAKYHRKQWTFPVIGLTGTNGKTTTKELIHAVLNEKFKTHATKGNLNNHIGLPLTVLNCSLDTQIAIIEMGANHPTEIADLCEIAQPTHGLITNVGKAHLEGFGGFEGVKKTKAELYQWLQKQNGSLFIQADNPFLIDMQAKYIPHPKEVIRYGIENEKKKDVFGSIVPSDTPFLKISWNSAAAINQVIETQLTGSYNLENILAAISIGTYFGLNASEINSGLAQYQPKNHRSQIQVKGNNTYICDFYNANPSSMAVAIENLASFPKPNKTAILGAMFELGAESDEEHFKLMEFAMQKNFKHLICIGRSFSQYKENFPEILFFEDLDSLKPAINSLHLNNAVVLIKGSRGMKMEQLIDIL